MAKGTSLTEYHCGDCGVLVTRPPTKGQRPKWCEECRRKGRRKDHKMIVCPQCGLTKTVTRQAKFCSLSCANSSRAKPKAAKVATSAFDPRGELRRGYEDGDADLFFAALVSRADTQGECWIWPRLNRSGYPAASWGRRDVSIHRVVLEVKHGASLGSQHAHHICANAACVNPDHLQPVTHRENIAEMLARQSYLARITELEQALAVVAPQHPLLSVVKVA